MTALLKKYPFFVALLPIFFVLHGYTAHARYIAFANIWPLFLALLLASGLLYIIFRVLLKQPAKAGLISLYCFGFYLFFGAIYDFLKAYSPWAFIWKYSVLLGVFLAGLVLIFFWLKRSKKDHGRMMLFFNTLFLIFIVMELVKLISTDKEKKMATGLPLIPAAIHKPDIYLLLFDEYSSTKSLRSMYQFDNSGLDSFLSNQGFHLLPDSRSNYPETSFSMASCLNMDYLPWLKHGMEIKREHYQRCAEEIRNNEVVRFLENNGYTIENQSVFDLQHHPAPVSQRWLSIDTRLITEETLLDRVCVEFSWFLNRYALLRKILPVTSYEEQMQNNDRCLAAVLKTSAERTETPRFIYGHFLLPHFPYYKDKDGQILPDSVVQDVMNEKLAPLPKYLEYVQYTNTEVKKLITGIRSNDPQAVIIFLSDHGYRWNVPVPELSNVFYNQNAVYFPSGDYRNFYDSITNVNQFRVIFNSLFHTGFPLLKDTCIIVQPGLSPN